MNELMKLFDVKKKKNKDQFKVLSLDGSVAWATRL